MRYLILIALFISGCGEVSEVSKIGLCYRENINSYSYKVTAVADGYFHVEYAHRGADTVSVLENEVSCDQFEEDRQWYTVKKAIDVLQNKVDVLEGKVK
jgi:hypothetical protein